MIDISIFTYVFYGAVFTWDEEKKNEIKIKIKTK
jgi:hypothetical protein